MQLQSHLTVFLGQLCIVQVSRQVDEEAAPVAVHAPLGAADRVQHQGSVITLGTGRHPLPDHAVLALGVGAESAWHPPLPSRPLGPTLRSIAANMVTLCIRRWTSITQLACRVMIVAAMATLAPGQPSPCICHITVHKRHQTVA